MIKNKYIIFALASILITAGCYILHFSLKLNYPISNNTSSWAELGEFFGGILGPILSFISIVLLIQSLKLQNDTNESLQLELNENKKTEKLKSFETLFFNMVNSQAASFKLLKIEFIENNESKTAQGAGAVALIEESVQQHREQGKTEQEIGELLNNIDDEDQIYSATRIYYVIVKTVSEKLSDTHGFSKEIRIDYFTMLINFTDFPLLRLIMMSLQFMKNPQTDYLKNSPEFNEALKSVKLSYQLY